MHAFASVMMIVAALAGLNGPAAAGAAEPKEPSMTFEHHAQMTAPFIPPIDETAPATFETASFGLG